MTFASMIGLGSKNPRPGAGKVSLDGSDARDHAPVIVYFTAAEARQASADLIRLAEQLEAAEAAHN